MHENSRGHGNRLELCGKQLAMPEQQSAGIYFCHKYQAAASLVSTNYLTAKDASRSGRQPQFFAHVQVCVNLLDFDGIGDLLGETLAAVRFIWLIFALMKGNCSWECLVGHIVWVEVGFIIFAQSYYIYICVVHPTPIPSGAACHLGWQKKNGPIPPCR